MDIQIMIVVMIAVMLVQLVLCMKARRTIVKWIPMLTILALMLLCGIIYAVSANWGYLIVIALLFFVLVGDGMAWLMGAVWRWMQDQKKDHL